MPVYVHQAELILGLWSSDVDQNEGLMSSGKHWTFAKSTKINLSTVCFVYIAFI